ncbi:unnamed protein product [Lota lota]
MHCKARWSKHHGRREATTGSTPTVTEALRHTSQAPPSCSALLFSDWTTRGSEGAMGAPAAASACEKKNSRAIVMEMSQQQLWGGNRVSAGNGFKAAKETQKKPTLSPRGEGFSTLTEAFWTGVGVGETELKAADGLVGPITGHSTQLEVQAKLHILKPGPGIKAEVRVARSGKGGREESQFISSANSTL